MTRFSSRLCCLLLTTCALAGVGNAWAAEYDEALLDHDAALSSLPSLPVAPPLPADHKPFPFRGVWKVSYPDKSIGIVSGEATVGRNEKYVRVEFTHPQTGQVHAMVARSVVRQGNRLIIILEERSPHGQKETGHNLPGQPVDVPEGQAAIQIADKEGPDKTSLNVTVIPRVPSDADTLILTLDYSGPNLLTGYWRYKADPVTGRDRNGFGCVYKTAVDEKGVLYQFGPETWRRPEPEIIAVIPLTNQTGFMDKRNETPSYPYPYQPGTKSTPSDIQRKLFVVGRNLPTTDDDPVSVTTDDPRMHYRLYATQQQASTDGILGEQMQRGWQRFLGSLPEKLHADARRELDAVIIDARLQDQALPGYKRFFLNGAEGDWVLKFGDNNARFAIVRAAGEDEYEETHTLFVPETFYLQVASAVVLPPDVRTIPALLSRNYDITPVGGEGGAYITLHRTAANSTIFRSAPIHLQLGARGNMRRAADGSITLPLFKGDRLTAVLVPEGLFSYPVAPSSATTAIDLANADSRWQKALRQAATCNGISVANKPDWAALSRKPVHEYKASIWVPYSIVDKVFYGRKSVDHYKRSLQVRLADHAAMILLRDTFIRMMNETLVDLGTIKNDEASLAAYREKIRLLVQDERNAIARIHATSPSQLDKTYGPFMTNPKEGYLLRHTYDLERFANDNNLVLPKARELVRRMTWEAVGTMKNNMKVALQQANELDPCNIESMLMMTGTHFDAVLNRVVPEMMRPPGTVAGDADSWTPDRYARANIKSLGVLAEAVREQTNFNKADRQFVLTIVSAASMPLMLGESVGSILLDMALTAPDAVYLVPDAIETYASKEELRFARGAAAVLGTARLDEAKAREKTWTSLYLDAVLSLGPNVASAGEVSKTFSILKKQSKLHTVQQSLRRAIRSRRGGRFVRWVRARAKRAGRTLAINVHGTPTSGLGDPVGPAASVPTKPARPASGAGNAEALRQLDSLIKDLASAWHDPMQRAITKGRWGSLTGEQRRMAQAALNVLVKDVASNANAGDMITDVVGYLHRGKAQGIHDVIAHAMVKSSLPPRHILPLAQRLRADPIKFRQLLQKHVDQLRPGFTVHADTDGLLLLEPTPAYTQSLDFHERMLHEVSGNLGKQDAVREVKWQAQRDVADKLSIEESVVGYAFVQEYPAKDMLRRTGLLREQAEKSLAAYLKRRYRDMSTAEVSKVVNDYFRDVHGNVFKQPTGPSTVADLANAQLATPPKPPVTQPATALDDPWLKMSDAELARIEPGALPEGAIEDIVAHLDRAASSSHWVGEEALTASQRSALDAVGYQSAGKTGAARTPHDHIRNVLGDLVDRADIRHMLETNAQALGDIVRQNPEQALEVLTTSPHRDIEFLRAAVSRERKRLKEPLGKAFYDQADLVKQSDVEDVLADNGFHFEVNLYDDEIDIASVDIKGNGKRVGLKARDLSEAANKRPSKIDFPFEVAAAYTRSYHPQSQTLIFEAAFLEQASPWIKAPIQGLSDKGVPTNLFMNMQAMQALGIGYHGKGLPLRRVVLKQVVNPRTLLQHAWMVKTYGEVAANTELAAKLFSVKYAESALTMAGYRIKRVKVHPAENLEKAFLLGADYKGREPFDAFLAKHGFNENSDIPAGFDIEIEVALSGAGSSSTVIEKPKPPTLKTSFDFPSPE